jgi:hypothetical protein
MGLPQYNGQYDGQSKTVYFKNTTGGSVTLLEGMALAFDMDDTAAPVSNTSDPKNARGVRVVKPATAVLGGFAGLVDETSAGIVVPDTEGRFITINVPRKGQPVKALVKANATKGVSLLGITNAGGFNLVPHVPGTGNDATESLAAAVLALDFVAVALETADTSTTAALKLVKLRLIVPRGS